jgi:hypothetical protein
MSVQCPPSQSMAGELLPGRGQRERKQTDSKRTLKCASLRAKVKSCSIQWRKLMGGASSWERGKVDAKRKSFPKQPGHHHHRITQHVPDCYYASKCVGEMESLRKQILSYLDKPAKRTRMQQPHAPIPSTLKRWQRLKTSGQLRRQSATTSMATVVCF